MRNHARPIWDNSHNRVVAIYGVAQDITDRKKVEEALKQNEEKLRVKFESIADGITITDLEANITDVNEAVLHMHGYSHKKEVIGRNAFELISQKDNARAAQNLRKTLEEGYSGAIEYSLLTKEGKEFDGELSASLLKDTSGNPTAFVAITRDITERKQAEEERNQSTEKLLNAMNTTIEAMALTVEVRDLYTAEHQRRVTKLAYAIANEIGLPKDKVERLRLSGIVHDIGKIYVPAEIISKPGRLNEIEFSMVKMHPQAGYDILKGIEFPWPIAQIVLQHHERMDGSGYPLGLKGEHILLEARILAVADVIEAMASHRPYRPALGTDAALEEISHNAGILYDSEVVEACMSLFYEKGFKLE
ncbi:MAG: HD-GYP domain-containing protein [Chloroflexi bacterium]|nr:HD-GYP domain-containing protein [Chloroflexota bacterium]